MSISPRFTEIQLTEWAFLTAQYNTLHKDFTFLFKIKIKQVDHKLKDSKPYKTKQKVYWNRWKVTYTQLHVYLFEHLCQAPHQIIFLGLLEASLQYLQRKRLKSSSNISYQLSMMYTLNIWLYVTSIKTKGKNQQGYLIVKLKW